MKKINKVMIKVGRILLLLLLLGGGGIYSLLYFYQDRLLFFPAEKSFNECLFDKTLDVEIFKDQGIRYYHFKLANPKGRLIHFHGNGGRACDWSYDARYYLAVGIEPIYIEYPGYALANESSGTNPSVKLIKHNVEQIAELIKKKDWQNVFIHGISLGTGPATYLATQIDVKGLILDHPYPRLSFLASFHYPLPGIKFFLKDDFAADLYAEKITAPVLINQGDRDQVIPYSIVLAQMENFKSWKKLKLYKGYGHNNLTMHEKYWDHIQEFILKYGLKEKSDDSN